MPRTQFALPRLWTLQGIMGLCITIRSTDTRFKQVESCLPADNRDRVGLDAAQESNYWLSLAQTSFHSATPSQVNGGDSGPALRMPNRVKVAYTQQTSVRSYPLL